MKRILKWGAYCAGAIVVLAVLAVIAVYARSEWLRNQTWHVPDDALTLDPEAVDGADIDEGRRLATVLGCFNGCHGERADGGVFLDIPNVARVVAPSLTHLASTRDDADMVRSIRFGVRPDGTSVWGMPSDALYHRSDRQIADIIAFLRSQPVSDAVDDETTFRLLARVGMTLGEFRPPPATTTAMPERLDPADSTDEYAAGRQLAMVACAECHGLDLQGSEGGTPALGIARGYDRAAFGKLMRTGRAMGDRDVGLMSRVARGRFSALTEREVDGLHAYLLETGGRDLVEGRSAEP